MRFLESVSSGIWVLRHRGFGQQGYALENRIGMFAVEMDRQNTGPGGLGEYVKIPKSIGDVTGAFFWPAAGRSIGGWSWLWGAMSMATSRESSSSGSGFPQFRDGGGVLVGAVVGDKDNGRFSTMKTQFILPVAGGMFADVRFAALVPPRPKMDGLELWPKFPRNWYGIALAATDEEKQANLWMPTDPRLVAVNWEGDPDCGTLVVDTNKKFEADPKRMAPLQSAFRVVRVKKKPSGMIGGTPPPSTGAGGGSAASSGFAHFVNPGGGDPFAGFHPGGFGEFGGGTGSPPAQGGRLVIGVNPAPTIRFPGDPFQVVFIEVDAPGAGGQVPALSGTPPGPCVDWRLRNMIGWNIALTGARDAMGGAVVDMPEGSASEEARNIGMVSKMVSGFIDVGGEKDKHQLDKDEDGNPINAAHIATNAYFRKNEKLDAPLRFEGEGKVLPRCGDFVMKVHLKYFENLHDADKCPSGEVDSTSAPAVYHPFACGKKRGIWAWYAQSKIGDEKTKTYTPDPKIKPGYGSSGAITPAVNKVCAK